MQFVRHGGGSLQGNRRAHRVPSGPMDLHKVSTNAYKCSIGPYAPVSINIIARAQVNVLVRDLFDKGPFAGRFV